MEDKERSIKDNFAFRELSRQQLLDLKRQFIIRKIELLKYYYLDLEKINKSGD